MGKKNIPYLNPEGHLVRTCSKCNNTFLLSSVFFHRNSYSRYGFTSVCKECSLKRKKKYYRDNRDRLLEEMREYREEKKEELLEKAKEYRQREDVKERSKVYQAEYYQEHTDEIKERTRTWSKENRDKKNEYNRAYNKINPDKPAKWQKRSREKASENPSWRINVRMSAAVRQSLRSKKDGRGWEELVGYTRLDLVKHIEKQFLTGMSWDNVGEWHIDHIIPQSAFNFESYVDIDFKRCWCLDNLRPLWSTDNLSKGAKLDAPFQPSIAFGGVL